MITKFKLSAMRESFAHTPRTLAMSWASAPQMCLVLVVLTVFAALLPLAVAYIGKLIVDAVVAGDQTATIRAVSWELGVIATQALVQRGLGLTRQLLGARMSVDINVRILAKAQTLDLAHFEDPLFYDQLTRARREASSRPISVITDSFQLMQNVLTLGGYIVLLLNYNAWAVLGLFLAALPAAFSEMHFSTAAFRLRNWRSPETRQLNYVEHVLSNDAHAKEVKLFRLGPRLLERYRTTGDRLYQEDKQLAFTRITWGYLLSLVGTAAFYLSYGFMAVAAALGRLTLGNLTLYVAAFRQGQQAFQSILSAIGGMYENNLYMSNLFAYLEIPVKSPVLAPRLEQSAAISAEQGVRFDNVGFQYPGQDRWALRGIDLFIPKGQSLALVGHNGAGKTTFIKLLTRLYRPTEGRILLDGKNLEHWPDEDLRRRIAVIFQDFNKYQFTFEENVTMGAEDHTDLAARMDRAIDAGGARDVVNQLPEGIKTPLGRWFQKGTELSGGQWQKIALARAFMREDADILVLDEPTAALDVEAEYAVFERFRTLTKGRTTILISHRFPTVRMADAIVVIEGGRIQESGTHAELIQKAGRYAQLFAVQAQGYL